MAGACGELPGIPGVRCLVGPWSAVVLFADTKGEASWARQRGDVLSAAERERAARFVFPGLGERWAAARVLLREALGRATCRSASKVRIRVDHLGKPSTDGVEFSLSHTGSVVLVGLGGVPLGVDVERIPEERTVQQVAPSLHPQETAGLLDLPVGERSEAFARVWVRKEALLKAIGTGLSRGLSGDYVGAGAVPGVPIPGMDIHDVVLPGMPDHRAALCTTVDAARTPGPPSSTVNDGVPSPSPIGRFPRSC